MIDVALSELLAEVSEQEAKKIATATAGYAESGPTFDPEGNYLCKDCVFRLEPDACATVRGKISMSNGGCIIYYRGEQLYQEPLPHQFPQEQVIYTERKDPGFGCKRCEYQKEGFCKQWSMTVLPNACCYSNEGPDDVVAPGDKKQVTLRGLDSEAWEKENWHGVDLDGTLAEYHGWKGKEYIGDPIPAMVARVKAWLDKGEQVKIFTARAEDPEAKDAVEHWCEKHLGQKLEVTNVKDQNMVDLWDDRAKQVEKNTGKLIEAAGVHVSEVAYWTEELDKGVNELLAQALFNSIQIEGFTGPEEEFVRAALSRVPPELTTGVKKILADRGMGAKHGNYDGKEKVIRLNPNNIRLRVRLGKGPGWMLHSETTMVHEIGHSIFENLSEEQKNEWNEISGWMRSSDDGDGSYSPRYVERRPGWPAYTSKWIHKKGVGFTRKYAEKSPDEDFSDSFSFFMLGKPFQMSPKKREFLENLIKEKVHKYPSALISGPTKAYGERGS